MSDLTLKLIDLVNNRYTINEISKELNLSNKQIFNYLTQLKNKGFNFEKKYYYNGDIIYTPKKSLMPDPANEVSIITTPEEQIFTAIVISDLHIGNKLERLDLLNKVYDYCAKEGINIIINCGDLIDGENQTKNAKEKIYDSAMEQIDYLIKMYPFDKNILNFTLLGNHDFSVLQNSGQDITMPLQSYRHDIILVGYEAGKINIKNSTIYLKHKIEQNNSKVKFYDKESSNSIVLNGHSHKMKVLADVTNCIISVPSLSDINYSDNNMIPTLLKINVSFESGRFKHCLTNQLLITDKIYHLNETLSHFNPNYNDKEILNEERRIKKLVKEEVITPQEPLSQIDKFYARYGNSIKKNF